MTLAGFSAVFLLGRAGEPVRPLLLSRKAGLPIADTFGIYVLERLLDTASTAVLAAIGLILFSSHVLSEVEQVCDRVAILHNGQLKGLDVADIEDNHRHVM